MIQSNAATNQSIIVTLSDMNKSQWHNSELDITRLTHDFKLGKHAEEVMNL